MYIIDKQYYRQSDRQTVPCAAGAVVLNGGSSRRRRGGGGGGLLGREGEADKGEVLPREASAGPLVGGGAETVLLLRLK